jgi:hypothetical protein
VKEFYAIRNKITGLWWGVLGDSHDFVEVPRLYPDKRSIRLALAQVKKKQSYFYVYNDPIPYRINTHKRKPEQIAEAMKQFEMVGLRLTIEGVLEV